ncbi:6-phosphofructokinase [Chloroflexota bacterium]
MGNGKRIGLMTGGGDCPGLNAAIRAVTKTALQAGYEVIGFRDGWKGLIEDNKEILDSIKTSGIIDRGGTILHTSRFSPLRIENGTQIALDRFKEFGLTALVVLGGEGTLSVTGKLFRAGLPVVGIPKTIDNDIVGTDYSIGFQTAVQIATDALDRLRSTAESHHRAMLLEVMGRTAGWIATYSGLANGADAILIPEIPLTEEKMEELCQIVRGRNEMGKHFSIIVVAEGVKLNEKDKAGIPIRTGELIGKIIEQKTGLETRFSSLDYIQRGGTPVAYDRNLALCLGVKAVELIQEGKYGEMAALKGNRITSTPLEQVVNKVKTVNLKVHKTAETFFG